MKSKDILASLEQSINKVILTTNEFVNQLNAQYVDRERLEAAFKATHASVGAMETDLKMFMVKLEQWASEGRPVQGSTEKRKQAAARFIPLANTAESAAARFGAVAKMYANSKFMKPPDKSLEAKFKNMLQPAESSLTVLIVNTDQFAKALSVKNREAAKKAEAAAQHSLTLAEHEFIALSKKFIECENTLGKQHPFTKAVSEQYLMLHEKREKAKARLASLVKAAEEFLADYVVHTQQN
jgi:hypothetical protein